MATAELEKRARLKVVDLNPHLSCILCGGYFIDATTITECLHSFCRACIVRYLETSKYCPVCEVQVHKTRPLRCIRSDRMLQDIVYKLVPGLFQNEMLRRRELYASQPPEALKESRDEEDRGEGLERRYIYTADEVFCLALQYRYDKSNGAEGSQKSEEEEEEKADSNDKPKRRFLRCPAAMKMNHLKKFIRVKYAIPKALQVALQFEEEALEDDYTLMDVAYISSWKRVGPLQLTFRILERAKVLLKRRAASAVDSEKNNDPPPTQTERSDAAEDVLAREEVAKSDSSESTIQNESVEETASAEDHVPNPKSPDPRSEEKPVAGEEPSAELLGSSTQDGSKVQTDQGQNDLKQPQTLDSAEAENADAEASDSSSFAANQKVASEGSESEAPPPPKVPKLTIPLTPKILQMAAQHAEDDKMELDSELYEGRLVIAEPELSPKAAEDDLSNNSKDSAKDGPLADFGESKKVTEMIDDDEIDSGRGSDSSSRAEARSLFGDEEVDSPGSSTVRTPDLEKSHPFALSSPSSLPSPTKNGGPEDTSKAISSLPKQSASSSAASSPSSSQKDDFGVLDLSVCHRKRGEDRVPLGRPKQVANPPVLDKFRQTTPCLPLPDHPSFKMFPAVLPHPSIYKKPDYPRGNFRFNRGSTLTVINPDPNSCRPKIVIKNLDPRPDHRHHHHHHHHHHHSHHHQKM